MSHVRRRASRRPEGDAGLSVMELIVSMAIFTVVLVVFFGSLISMSKATARASEIADASDSLRITFQTLDKQIRYASSINRPGTGTSGSWYVEFIATDLPDSQLPLCTQWKFDPTAETLSYRTWRDDASATVSGWRPVAFDVSNDVGAGQVPFVFDAAGASFTRQQLTVAVHITGEPGPAGTLASDVSTVFVARNSSFDSPSNADLDGNGQSDTLVCTSHLSRP